MLIWPYQAEHWRLLTPTNIRARQLWGWGYSIQKILGVSEPMPCGSDNLLIASDYGGDHGKSTHLIYCYLVVKGGARDWMAAVKSARLDYLRDGRTLSYKRLGDTARQHALFPFLEAAANLDGHLVAVAVDKKKKWLSTWPSAAESFQNHLQLKASWNRRALENMIRKVQFTAIILSIWSQPYSNVTWITDQDEFVANDVRHDDALRAVARMCSFYFSHPMGILRLNTTGQDTEASDFEDLCAIPDLAAGMLSEISTRLTLLGHWGNLTHKVLEDQLPTKAEVIASWFWDMRTRLRKTLIVIDTEGSRFAVRKISMQYA